MEYIRLDILLNWILVRANFTHSDTSARRHDADTSIEIFYITLDITSIWYCAAAYQKKKSFQRNAKLEINQV